jgi:hypothetical protein
MSKDICCGSNWNYYFRMIYVAEWGTRSLKGLRIDSSNNLVEEWVNTFDLQCNIYNDEFYYDVQMVAILL